MHLWSQLQTRYRLLSLELMEVFKAPAGTSGVERNQKVGSSVLLQRRCRVSEGLHKRQVVIAHNGCQLKRPLNVERDSLFAKVLKCTCRTEDDTAASLMLTYDESFCELRKECYGSNQ